MPNNNKKPIYFTSDLHVGQEIVIVFYERPFRDIDHMH